MNSSSVVPPQNQGAKRQPSCAMVVCRTLLVDGLKGEIESKSPGGASVDT